MERLLRQQGYDVTTADGVAAALRACAAAPFAVVVSDIGLPDGSGLTSCGKSHPLSEPARRRAQRFSAWKKTAAAAPRPALPRTSVKTG